MGITKLVYLSVSHYHQDHIGCVPEAIRNVQVTSVLDRGLSYKSTFCDAYIAAIRAKGRTGSISQTSILDQDSAQPEGTVAANVGKLDLYKVHHHCSSHSSNDDWLSKTSPTIGIVNGVMETLIVNVDLGTNRFTVAPGGNSESYPIGGAAPESRQARRPRWLFSNRPGARDGRKLYYYATCQSVKNIAKLILRRECASGRQDAS